MLRLPISQIVDQAAAAETIQEKVKILQKHDHPALRTYLGLAINKNVKWLIPPGKPLYKPCKELDVEWALYNEVRRLYIFFPGGNPNLTDARREALFITLLESVTPSDAEFLCDVVKDHKLPVGLDETIIRNAFSRL